MQSVAFEEECSHNFPLQKEADCFTRADLRHLLEKAGGTQPRNTRARLLPSQITELLNALDPEHTGVIPMANLERLNPNISSAPSAAPPPSPANTTEPLDVPEMAEHTAVCLCVCVRTSCSGYTLPCQAIDMYCFFFFLYIRSSKKHQMRDRPHSVLIKCLWHLLRGEQ